MCKTKRFADRRTTNRLVAGYPFEIHINSGPHIFFRIFFRGYKFQKVVESSYVQLPTSPSSFSLRLEGIPISHMCQNQNSLYWGHNLIPPWKKGNFCKGFFSKPLGWWVYPHITRKQWELIDSSTDVTCRWHLITQDLCKGIDINIMPQVGVSSK